ncbi:cardiolipin synthase (CMP-forming) isoform X2 [Petromyzon marinus]|uniref:cardiolipin synthase (CMP-forming) isoform X2 n=1 Tax=Petromyzon marinus TaxID=7757 RepID=UPI003F6FE13E
MVMVTMSVLGRCLRSSSTSSSFCLSFSHSSVLSLSPSSSPSSSSPSLLSPSLSPPSILESKSPFCLLPFSTSSSPFSTLCCSSLPSFLSCPATFLSSCSTIPSSSLSPSPPLFSPSVVGKTRGYVASLRHFRRPGSPATTTIRSPSFGNRSTCEACCYCSCSSSSRHRGLCPSERSLRSPQVVTSGWRWGHPLLRSTWRGVARTPHAGGSRSAGAKGPEEGGGGSDTRGGGGGGDASGAASGTRAPGNSAKENIFSELYENPWTVPNALCVTRIALSPVIACLVADEEFGLALGLLLLAGVTDLLDGFIARTWPSQQSALGSALDPLADKILISVLYISLTCAHLIPVPLTALIISRDIALIGAVFYVRYRTVPPPCTLARYFNPRFATAQLKPTLISKATQGIFARARAFDGACVRA